MLKQCASRSGNLLSGVAALALMAGAAHAQTAPSTQVDGFWARRGPSS
jgi:hypothetical protein